MTTERIDVLAVMDASAEKITFLAQKTGVYHPATELAEARAAVAELIEAVRLYRRARFLNAKSEHGDRAAIARELGLDEYSGLLIIQCEAFDRVETALARVGGA